MFNQNLNIYNHLDTCCNFKEIISLYTTPLCKNNHRKLTTYQSCFTDINGNLIGSCWRLECVDKGWSRFISKCANKIADGIGLTIQEGELTDKNILANILGISNYKIYNHFNIKHLNKVLIDDNDNDNDNDNDDDNDDNNDYDDDNDDNNDNTDNGDTMTCNFLR